MTGLRFEFMVTAILFAVVILINQYFFQKNIAVLLAILAISVQFISSSYFKKYGHFNIFLVKEENQKEKEKERIEIYNKLKDGMIELEDLLKKIIDCVEKKKKK